MQATATRFAASWDLIRNSTTTSLADKVKAFQSYSQAATEANHGVETSEIAVQREMLRMQIIGQATGTSIATSMGVGKDGVDKLLDSLRNVKPQPGLDGNNYNGNVSSPGDSNGPKYSGKRGESGNDRPDGPSDRSGSTFLDSFGVERTRNSGAPVGTFTNTVPLDKAKAVANGVGKTKYTAADIPCSKRRTSKRATRHSSSAPPAQAPRARCHRRPSATRRACLLRRLTHSIKRDALQPVTSDERMRRRPAHRTTRR
ncbi:hypothetical protein RCH10_003825 [Variovorax sp. GrIS 2.14]|uniref:hypothetical protein n=1 Tax=Variovorax sp. GrIS 2.14 TaxID=3071709 RepID=UPI0019BAF2E8|nr:hypothetical protein [Ramlibacter sp.]